MNRRRFLAQAAALPVVAGGLSLKASGAASSPTASEDARLAEGRPFYARYRLTRERVLSGTGPSYSSPFLLSDLRGESGRRFTNFSGDLSGRWIGALASCSATYKEEFPALRPFVESALKLQHPEGYFGKSFNTDDPSDDDLALLWGNGRFLVGLTEYYSLSQDPAVLRAARQLGDFLVKIAPRFNSQQMEQAFGSAHFATSYICWTQQTEGLAELYALTKDVRYRDACADIARRITRRPGDHVHGFLCSVRGALNLYKATGDDEYLQMVSRHWKDVTASGDILVTGGVPEAWSPKRMRTEGCAECDWLRLNLDLHAVTGQEEFLCGAEDILFNEFSMNQFWTGDFGHALLGDFGRADYANAGAQSGTGEPGIVLVRAWWCCTLHGLRAFPAVQQRVFRQSGDQLIYQIPVDGSFESDGIKLVARSYLATQGKVEIKVERASRRSRLQVRQPHWADAIVLSHKDHAVPGLLVSDLETGDVITIQYPMKMRVSPLDVKGERKTFHVGPWLLGATAADQQSYFNELHRDNVLLEDSLQRVSSTNALSFGVPIAGRRCSVLSAEYPKQSSEVELRAVSEQTARPPSRWNLSFRTKSA
jgi:DUF1680 family protein